MTINDYINKHEIKALAQSDTQPEFIPTEAFSAELSSPSFTGRNTDSSIFVTLYSQNGTFIAYEKDKRRITGNIDEDIKDLG